jgi:hypothetical protein
MEITCHFKDVYEYGNLLPDQKKTKKGRYHGSNFPVDGFGVTQWVICAYLVVPEYNHYISLGLTDKQIVEGCIEHLNKPPARKKYQRRVRKPLYGDLSLYRFKQKDSEESQEVFEVLFITDQRLNKNFWSEGIRVIAPRKRKKRKK